MGKGVVKLGEGNWAVKDGNLLAAKETNNRFKNAEFTVARGTRATYVGRDGLIKESNLQDTNLVQNGDFEELGNQIVNISSLSGNNWTADGSGGFTNNGSGEGLSGSLDVSTIVGETYKFTFDVTISGVANATFGGFTIPIFTTSGSKEYYVTATSSSTSFSFYLAPSGSPSMFVNNISVKQVDPNDRWTLSSTFEIDNGKLHCVSDGSYQYAYQGSAFVVGKTYKITFDVLDYTSGSIRVRPSGQSGYTAVSANGTYTQYFTATDTTLAIERNSACDLYVDNVSIQEVKTDTPRIDFTDNTDGHLLLEPQSTNLVTYSEDFNEWTNTDITFGADGVSPSGETNANLIQTGTAGSDQVSKVFTLSATNTTTYSVFIKRVSGAEWIDFLIVKSGFSHSLKVWFNINNGTVGSNNETGTTTFDSASIEDYGNDWYRLIVTTTDSTNNTSFNIRVRTASADGSDTRVNNSSYYLWGMQLEALSHPTSYMFTSGSTVTRDAETCTGAGEAVDFNSEEGVLYAEIAALADDGTYRFISLNDGTFNNAISIRFDNSSNTIKALLRLSSVNQALLSYSFSTIQFYKIAFKYKANDFALWINGVEVATDTSGSTFSSNTLTQLDFYRGDNTNHFYGKCKAIRVYKDASIDLATLTS